MPEVSQITSQMINSGDVFATVLKKMHEEGHGTLTAQIMTPSDAAKIVLARMFGMVPESGPVLLLLECDKFLSTLDEHHPVCSAGECDHPMNTHSDVGCIVILHGMTDQPTAVIVAGICDSCWKEKFASDREKAMNGFMEYLQKCLGTAEMKVYDREQWEQRMNGNAPTSQTVN